MALKQVFVEITKQCRVAGKECGVGSIVEVPENDGNYLIGLKKAKRSEAKAEKILPIAKGPQESKAGEKDSKEKK